MNEDKSLQEVPEEGGGCGDFEPGTLLKMAALTRENPNAASLLLTILAKAGEDCMLVVSHATLAKLCEFTVPAVEQAVADLVAEGWINKMIIGSGDPAPIAYVINSRIYSPKNREVTEYVDFQARILLSGEDNPYLKERSL